MEKLTVLGTGHAATLNCYNTCFTLSQGDEHFLVDAGGGNGVLVQLRKAGIKLGRIRHAFLSHCHTDHLLGMIWILRMTGSRMRRPGDESVFHLYCHAELAETVATIARLTLPPRIFSFFGDRIRLVPVEDGQTLDVMGHEVTFFDINADKERQYGFMIRDAGGKKLTFLGDEPFNETSAKYVSGCDWMLCEAFCRYCDREKFRPYDYHHGTVREGCEVAERFRVRNLVLWHTEDAGLGERKALYASEGRGFCSANIFVPDDLDVIEL